MSINCTRLRNVKKDHKLQWWISMGFFVFFIVAPVFYFSVKYVYGINHVFVQSGWSGGVSNNVATHTSNQTGWNQMAVKDAGIVIDGSGDLLLTKADVLTETTDVDFASNESQDVTLSVGGDAIRLLKADSATCIVDDECQGNICYEGICNTCGYTMSFNGYTYGTVMAADELCWLDRNLGASRVALSYNDSSSYGWLYQWGRLSDGHQGRSSAKTWTNSSNDIPGHSKFVLEKTQPLDWRAPQNNNLWQGVEGINNPCPSGWRIPTQGDWDNILVVESISNRATAYSSTLKLTAGGIRVRGTGALGDVSSYGRYWSSTIFGVQAYNLSFWSTTATATSKFDRAQGLSIRCIKN